MSQSSADTAELVGALRQLLHWAECSRRGRIGTSAPAYRQQQRALKRAAAALKAFESSSHDGSAKR